MAIAAARCMIQLSILGYVLVPIMAHWWSCLLYAAFMIAVAGAETISRPPYAFNGMLVQTLIALGSSGSLVMVYSMLIIIQPSPLWNGQYLIPTFGMLLGNAISCMSIGLSTTLEELTTGKDRVELLLSLGATRLEATRSLVQHSMTTALTPVLNQMSVIGLVSIPGMMTGQILGGSPPDVAARYQMVLKGVTRTAAAARRLVVRLRLAKESHSSFGEDLEIDHLRDLMVASDDDRESVLSGGYLEAGDGARDGPHLAHDSRRSSVGH
ncbi:hypothetical protein WJX73_000242 [Symbiochloris irregularis]|uniref:Uncharacterized protein n=1 Tax=Symbiochloris irregularis TaxID=706552 RepID=A0AAW1PZ31_9CHLO